MTVPRLILIVSVLVLTLYVVGVALARRNQEGKADTESGFVSWVGSLVAKSDAVPAEDLRFTNCQPGASRAVRIAPNVPFAAIAIERNSKKKIRRLTLRLPQGTSKQWIIIFKPTKSEEDEVRMPDEQVLFKGSSLWPSDGKRTVPIGPGGGTVTIQRAGPDPSELIIQLK